MKIRGKNGRAIEMLRSVVLSGTTSGTFVDDAPQQLTLFNGSEVTQ